MPDNIIISGIIYDQFDSPIRNVLVKVFDKDLRTEKLLGEKRTDAKGYQVSYNVAAATNPEYKSADIQLKVFNDQGQLLGQSPIYFNVQQNTTIDYKLGNTSYRGVSEFDALLQKIKPITDAEQVQLGQLQENEQFHDISFLAGETGEDAERIKFLNTAFAHLKATRIPADIFYGLFRQGLPLELNVLLLVKKENLENTIRQAIDENIISSKWLPGLEKIIQLFNAQSAKQVLNSDDNSIANFRNTISIALPAAQQKIFTTTYLNNESTPEKFWEQLKLQAGFTEENAEKVKQALRLNLLTDNQPELARQLFKKQQEDPSLKNGFAKFTRDNWIEQIKKAGVENFPATIKGDTKEEKIANYAASLEQLHKQLYPTGFFAQRITNSSFNLKNELQVFFDKNQEFDLLSNNIAKQFEKSNFESIQDKAGVKKEIKSLNRLYKLTGEFDGVNALYGQKLFSAADIVRKYNRKKFSEKFAASLGSVANAEKIYKKAATVDKKSTAVLAAYKMRHDVLLYAIHGNSAIPKDYAGMFGDGELCECDHCQSVYSPAAYFVDLLKFISDYSEDAFIKLMTLRPDLEYIKLTCKNTNTPLPYLDLVNELLEKYVIKLSTPAGVTPDPPAKHSYQTEGDAAELIATPEHVTANAYPPLKTIIGKVVFSPTLPLDLPLEETRLYTDKLGWKRIALLRNFMVRMSRENTPIPF